MSGHPLESRSLVAQTLEELGDDDGVVALNLTLELAIDHYWRGEFTQMHEVASQVLDRARGRYANLLTAYGGALCSIASTALSRPTEALSELATAKAAYAALPDEGLVDHIEVCGFLAQAASAVEHIDDALDCARRGLRLAQATGQGPYISGHLLLQANALVMKGRITEAAAVAETATDAAVLSGNDQFIVWALWSDAMVCTSTGDTARAISSAREALARSAHLTETFFSSLSRLHLSAALLATGDAAAARNELSAFEAGPDQRLLDLRGGHGWELLIRIQLALGELTAAAESAETAVARALRDLATATERGCAPRQGGGAARPGRRHRRPGARRGGDRIRRRGGESGALGTRVAACSEPHSRAQVMRSAGSPSSRPPNARCPAPGRCAKPMPPPVSYVATAIAGAVARAERRAARPPRR